MRRAAQSRADFADEAEVADDLGFGGIVRRLGRTKSSPRSESEDVYAALWDGTLADASREVCTILERAGIPFFFYKGGAMLGREYAPGDVFMADLDLFVPLGRSKEAVAVLGTGGWTPRPPVGGPSMKGGPGTTLLRARTGSAVRDVEIDLHWRTAPVTRLFPWRGSELPGAVWSGVDTSGLSPRPRAGHHAALLVHHLVRHDGLHVRSLFDLSLLWTSAAGPEEQTAFRDLARRLGVEREAGRISNAFSRDLGLEPLVWSEQADRGLNYWVDLALDSAEGEFERMTSARIRRRIRTIDAPILGTVGLLREGLLPPPEYLAWRWPETARPFRLIRHLTRQLSRGVDA